MADFERLGVCPEIIRAIEEDEWLLPTPVQDDAIPLILGGSDVYVAAETGSGKTGAFGIPCLQIVHETRQQKALTCGSRNQRGSVTQCIFDINRKDPLVSVRCSGLEASSESRKWLGIKTTGDVLRGKYMFEVEILNSGLTRVGWASSSSSFELGTDGGSFGYGGTGQISCNRNFKGYGLPFTNGDIIGCFINRDSQTISFSKNGQFFGTAFTLPSNLYETPLKPAICGKEFHVRLNTSATMQYPVGDFVPFGLIVPSHTSVGIDRGGQTRRPLCLILEPTRDLAQQTYDCVVHFGKYLESPTIRTTLFVGGVNEAPQRQALQRGVDIVVGTLPKVVSYVKRRELNLSDVRVFVLDEADELIKHDENNDIPKLKQLFAAAGGHRVQTVLFSATLHSPEVQTSMEKITTNPIWIDLKGKPSIPETVHLVVYKVDPTQGTLLCAAPSVAPPTDGVHIPTLIDESERYSQETKLFKPRVAVAIADAFDMRSCLVFCRTNLDCDNFEQYLINLGGGRKFTEKMETGIENPYSCVVLAGLRSQEERRRNLEYFKAGDVRFLVCTDVAARGIDIQDLPFLIILSLPEDPDQFFHRVGRVGRADRMGLAISIVSTEKEKVWYHKCSNRGKGCINRNLVNDGGCCIWFDESFYLAAIEQRIGQSLPVMDPKDFSVKDRSILWQLLGIIDLGGKSKKSISSEESCSQRRKFQFFTPTKESQQNGKLLMYGKPKGGHMDRTTLEHLRELAPSVEELKLLEKQIQQNYIQLLSNGIKSIVNN